MIKRRKKEIKSSFGLVKLEYFNETIKWADRQKAQDVQSQGKAALSCPCGQHMIHMRTEHRLSPQFERSLTEGCNEQGTKKELFGKKKKNYLFSKHSTTEFSG